MSTRCQASWAVVTTTLWVAHRWQAPWLLRALTRLLLWHARRLSASNVHRASPSIVATEFLFKCLSKSSDRVGTPGLATDQVIDVAVQHGRSGPWSGGAFQALCLMSVTCFPLCCRFVHVMRLLAVAENFALCLAAVLPDARHQQQGLNIVGVHPDADTVCAGSGRAGACSCRSQGRLVMIG